jgi:hypothetical protein
VPSLDKSSDVKDNGAIGESGEKRCIIGNVTIYNFGRRRKCGKIASGSNESLNEVTLSDKSVAKSSSKVTRCTGDHYLLHSFTLSLYYKLGVPLSDSLIILQLFISCLLQSSKKLNINTLYLNSFLVMVAHLLTLIIMVCVPIWILGSVAIYCHACCNVSAIQFLLVRPEPFD